MMYFSLLSKLRFLPHLLHFKKGKKRKEKVCMCLTFQNIPL